MSAKDFDNKENSVCRKNIDKQFRIFHATLLMGPGNLNYDDCFTRNISWEEITYMKTILELFESGFWITESEFYRYSGSWRNGKQHGRGVMLRMDRGNWFFGTFIGEIQMNDF